MAGCHLLHIPPAAAALGAFNPLLVDNGGPYRTRLSTMACALLGGAAALVLGSLLPESPLIVVPVTLIVCFVLTYARVLSQPIASTSVLILILYFAGVGGTLHTLPSASLAAMLVLLGGGWSIGLSLILWPVDAFRPARLGVAQCFLSLAEFTLDLATSAQVLPHSNQTGRAHTWQRQQRTHLEAAWAALSGTAARAPSRTVRARNLTVLLETSDMLLARTLRLTELTQHASSSEGVRHRLEKFAGWLAAAERAIGEAVAHRPADGASSFAPAGSHRLQLLKSAADASPADTSVMQLLAAEEREALLELGIAFDAVHAIWTGVEASLPTGVPNSAARFVPVRTWNLVVIDSTWRDSLRANFTLHSTNLRHALRVALVGTLDVVLMRLIHLNHGFWLPMTSILLMQPFSAGTNRKSLQRVSGTMLGGIVAAFLALVIPGSLSLVLILSVLSGLTLATFSVDYALYSFFLTPTFVLLSLPHPHDWRYAGIRIGLTLAGAAIAVLAMRLLWPERAQQEISHLLRRGAAAEAGYLEATILFWSTPAPHRRLAEREVLAPARRACGLASNDAEEALDRVLQEPTFRVGAHFGSEARGPEEVLGQQALAFTTYLRRLTQSITMLAPLGGNSLGSESRLKALSVRLERIAKSVELGPCLPHNLPPQPGRDLSDVADQQIRRMERQIGVLERTAATLPR